MAYTKTHKYLYPSLAFGYDAGLLNFLVDLDKSIINSFIGDMDYEQHVTACLFLLTKKTVMFEHIQKYFQSHKAYQDDYNSGSMDSKMHMFVLKLPDDRAYNWFVLSRYSKMYDKKFIDKVFKLKDGTLTDQYHIMMKTPQKWVELQEEYNFSTNVEPLEYEKKIKLDEEVYNFQITKG